MKIKIPQKIIIAYFLIVSCAKYKKEKEVKLNERYEIELENDKAYVIDHYAKKEETIPVIYSDKFHKENFKNFSEKHKITRSEIIKNIKGKLVALRIGKKLLGGGNTPSGGEITDEMEEEESQDEMEEEEPQEEMEEEESQDEMEEEEPQDEMEEEESQDEKEEEEFQDEIEEEEFQDKIEEEEFQDEIEDQENDEKAYMEDNYVNSDSWGDLEAQQENIDYEEEENSENSNNSEEENNNKISKNKPENRTFNFVLRNINEKPIIYDELLFNPLDILEQKRYNNNYNLYQNSIKEKISIDKKEEMCLLYIKNQLTNIEELDKYNFLFIAEKYKEENNGFKYLWKYPKSDIYPLYNKNIINENNNIFGRHKILFPKINNIKYEKYDIEVLTYGCNYKPISEKYFKKLSKGKNYITETEYNTFNKWLGKKIVEHKEEILAAAGTVLGICLKKFLKLPPAAFNIIRFIKVVKRASSCNKGVKVPHSKILTWGPKSNGHLIKHRNVLGYAHESAQEAQKILPKLRSSVNQLLNKSNPKLTRIGKWHQNENAIMHICEGKMIVTDSSGKFITVINKTSNNWYNLAKPLK